jgi:hypothetical protein
MRAVLTRAAGDGAFTFTAATAGIKRDGLDLKMDGGRVENYLANPVVLWAHDYFGERLPIGRALGVRLMKTKVKARVQFDMGDEFAAQVARKYEEGYLNTVSIGWDIISMGDDGRTVEEWDLLDISAVPVPGDPAALVERKQTNLRWMGRALLDADNDRKEAAEAQQQLERALLADDDDDGEWLVPPGHIRLGGWRSSGDDDETDLLEVAARLWRLLPVDGETARSEQLVAAAVALKEAAQHVIDTHLATVQQEREPATDGEDNEDEDEEPETEPAPDPEPLDADIGPGAEELLTSLSDVLGHAAIVEPLPDVADDTGAEDDG